MAGRRSSSSRSRSPKPGNCKKCSVPHSQLVELQTQGFLPPAYTVPVRAGLATYNGGEQAEIFPNPSMGERVCLVPYLLRGLGFPIHPFLRGLLEFYGLLLHNFTPPPYYTLLAMSPFASCCWAVRLISSYGRGYSASYPVHRRGQYTKWAESKYGASPGPDICPVLRRRHPKIGLRSGFI